MGWPTDDKKSYSPFGRSLYQARDNRPPWPTTSTSQGGPALNSVPGGSMGTTAQNFFNQFPAEIRTKLVNDYNAGKFGDINSNPNGFYTAASNAAEMYLTTESANQQTAQDAVKQTEEQKLARQLTNQNMGLLNNALNQQRTQGMAGLRSNLAQRGLMDSGSLGGGINKLNTTLGGLAQEGALRAGQQESATLLDFLNQRRQQEFANRMAQQQAEYAATAQANQNSWQSGAMQQQNTWNSQQAQKQRDADLWGNLLGGVGGVAGPILGNWFANKQYSNKSYTYPRGE